MDESVSQKSYKTVHSGTDFVPAKAEALKEKISGDIGVLKNERIYFSEVSHFHFYFCGNNVNLKRMTFLPKKRQKINKSSFAFILSKISGSIAVPFQFKDKPQNITERNN